jgi:hypothetical protein
MGASANRPLVVWQKPIEGGLTDVGKNTKASIGQGVSAFCEFSRENSRHVTGQNEKKNRRKGENLKVQKCAE